MIPLKEWYVCLTTIILLKLNKADKKSCQKCISLDFDLIFALCYYSKSAFSSVQEKTWKIYKIKVCWESTILFFLRNFIEVNFVYCD